MLPIQQRHKPSLFSPTPGWNVLEIWCKYLLFLSSRRSTRSFLTCRRRQHRLFCGYTLSTLLHSCSIQLASSDKHFLLMLTPQSPSTAFFLTFFVSEGGVQVPSSGTFKQKNGVRGHRCFESGSLGKVGFGQVLLVHHDGRTAASKVQPAPPENVPEQRRDESEFSEPPSPAGANEMAKTAVL